MKLTNIPLEKNSILVPLIYILMFFQVFNCGYAKSWCLR